MHACMHAGLTCARSWHANCRKTLCLDCLSSRSLRDWTPKKKEIDTGSNRKMPLSKVSEMPAIRFLSISERYAYPFASLSLKNVQLWWWGMIPVGVRFSTGMQYRSRRTFVRQLWRMTNSLSASNDRFRMISSALADDAVPIARLANPSNSARKSSVVSMDCASDM